MTIKTKLTASILASCLMLLTAVISNSAIAAGIGIPGSSISPSGTPSMTHTVSVRANRGSWTIAGNRDFFFDDGSTVWSGSNAQYKLSVDFDSAGNFLTGDLSIRGKIDGLTPGNGPMDLVTADVISFDFDALYDDTLVGFGIDNIFCSSVLGIGDCAGFTESVWVSLDAAFLGDPTARFKNSGTAVTTLPLPAAVWLFGSGLALLGVTARRRRKSGM